MRTFLRCALAFFVRDAQMSVSYKFAFVMGLLSTLTRTLALWLPAQIIGQNALFADAGGFLPFTVIGTSMMGFFMASYGGFATSIRAEQTMGTLESVMVTRAPLSALLLGSSAFSLANALLDVVLILGTGLLLFNIHFQGSILAALFVVLFTSLSFVALGFFSAAFTLVFKRGDPFRMFVGGASLLIGGVIYPTSVLPQPLIILGEFLPITHGARALRGIVLSGHTLWQHLSDLLALGAFAGILLPSGLFLFYRAVERAKLDGSLLQY